MKLAILGAGMIVKDFLIITKDLPEIELTAIVGTENDKENMQLLSELYGIKSFHTDFDECLESCNVDTVYVALPNHLHFSFAKKALEAGKNVICEKPFTLKLEEMLKLKEIAINKNLVLVEAITNQYLENYRQIKKEMNQIGEVKLFECNYSQYSSRYDSFKKGEILPTFNPKFGGGALMDINIYNIHFVIGLLGEPQFIKYYANIEKGIDTSGILILDYGDTKAVCIGAKDSTATIRSTIQGNKGSIIVNGPTNVIDFYDKQLNSEPIQRVDHKVHVHRMYEEFKKFNEVIETHDMTFVEQMLDHSEKVMKVVEVAIDDAGIILG